MPIMTLVEYAKGAPAGQANIPYIEMFARSSDVSEVLPIDGINGPVYEGTKSAALPSVAFRGINENSTSGLGRVETYQEATYVVDHDIDVDDAIIRRNGMERRTREEALAMTALGRLFLDTFIKGDNTTNPREFSGLQKRCDQYSNRKLAAGSTSGGDALSLTKLDEAIARVNAGTSRKYIIAPRAMLPRFIGAARNTSISGFVTQTWDDVGKPKLTYAGIPILFGYEPDKHSTFMPFTEACPGGGATGSSIYVVALGGDRVRGIQLKEMGAEDVGRVLTGSKPVYRTHISWDVGIVDEHDYGVCRLWGVKDAAIVA